MQHPLNHDEICRLVKWFLIIKSQMLRSIYLSIYLYIYIISVVTMPSLKCKNCMNSKANCMRLSTGQKDRMEQTDHEKKNLAWKSTYIWWKAIGCNVKWMTLVESRTNGEVPPSMFYLMLARSKSRELVKHFCEE